MIFLVLTEEGLAEVQQSACEAQATIWHNPGLLTSSLREMFTERSVTLHELEAFVDPEDDKAAYAVLMQIEKHHPNDEIYLEML